ncbi:MAG TPA: alpha/beta hydrolase, partial [Mycobacteriales bacterium]|nr:alpha/beta hydrolase [Mycobacteriales bacterium]
MRRRFALLAILGAVVFGGLPAMAAGNGPVDSDVLRLTRLYGLHPDQALDIYVSAVEPLKPRPTVLLIHGGSWQIGGREEWQAEATALARQGWTAISIDYRLSPEFPWPAQYDDVSAALGFVRARADQLGVDPARIGALGDSAGGHLAGLLGRPAGDVAPVGAVVTWSGINDMAALTTQPQSGGCPPSLSGCSYRGLALKVVRDLMTCTPAACPEAYRAASPAHNASKGSPPTFAVGSEFEGIDPAQAWAMDSSLQRAGALSRVRIFPGKVHGRGLQPAVWTDSVRFLAAMLTPGAPAPWPAPASAVTLNVPSQVTTADGALLLEGVVRPRAMGSSVALQVRGGDGHWRTVRTTALRAGSADTYYEQAWRPPHPGTWTWRAVWSGGGSSAVSAPRIVKV